MPTTVTFTSKDPQLAAFYEDLFGERFLSQLKLWKTLNRSRDDDPDSPDNKGGLERLKGQWDRLMIPVAEVQEHYDWVDLDEDQTNWQGKVIGKKRQVVLNEDGTPKLLIPEVVVRLS